MKLLRQRELYELASLLDVADAAARKLAGSYKRREIEPRMELDDLIAALPRLVAWRHLLSGQKP